MTDTFRVEDDRWLWVGERRFPMARWVTHDHDLHVAKGTMHTRQARLDFESKLSLSILWGNATYSSNYEVMFGDREFTEEPTTVEVGVLNDDGLIGDPLAWQTVEDVLRVIDAINRGEVPLIVFGDQ